MEKAISIFDAHSHLFKEKDIYKLSVEQILSTEITESNSKSKEKDKQEGSVLLGSGNDWWLRRILSHKASMLYGKGTKWCVTEKDPTHFNNYSIYNLYYYQYKKEKFAIIIDPTGKKELEDTEGCSHGNLLYNAKDKEIEWIEIPGFSNVASFVQEDKYLTDFQKYYDKFRNYTLSEDEASKFLIYCIDNNLINTDGSVNILDSYIDDFYINFDISNQASEHLFLNIKSQTIFGNLGDDLIEDFLTSHKDDDRFFECISDYIENYGDDCIENVYSEKNFLLKKKYEAIIEKKKKEIEKQNKANKLKEDKKKKILNKITSANIDLEEIKWFLNN